MENVKARNYWREKVDGRDGQNPNHKTWRMRIWEVWWLRRVEVYRKGRDNARKDVTVDTHNFSDLLCWMVCCSGYSLRSKPSPVEMEHKLYYYSFSFSSGIYLHIKYVPHWNTGKREKTPCHKNPKFVYESISSLKISKAIAFLFSSTEHYTLYYWRGRQLPLKVSGQNTAIFHLLKKYSSMLLFGWELFLDQCQVSQVTVVSLGCVRSA